MFKCHLFYDHRGFVFNLPVSSKCWNRLGQMSITANKYVFLLFQLTISLYIGFCFKIFRGGVGKMRQKGKAFLSFKQVSDGHVLSELLTISWTLLGSQQCQPLCKCPALWKKYIMKSGRAAGCSALLKMRSLNKVSTLIGT